MSSPGPIMSFKWTGRIVHEIDLRDASTRPEATGLEAILRGWSATGWTDTELERHGIALFEGLYRALK